MTTSDRATEANGSGQYAKVNGINLDLETPWGRTAHHPAARRARLR
jgi:hypothetical protein